jgi:hypothetical protein
MNKISKNHFVPIITLILSIYLASCSPSPSPINGKWGLTTYYDSVLINRSYYQYCNQGFWDKTCLDFDYSKDSLYTAGIYEGFPVKYSVKGVDILSDFSLDYNYYELKYDPIKDLLNLACSYNSQEDTLHLLYRRLGENEKEDFSKNLVKNLFEGNYIRVFPNDNKAFSIQENIITGFDKAYKIGMWLCDATIFYFRHDALFLVDTIDNQVDDMHYYNWAWQSDSLILKHSFHTLDEDDLSEFVIGDTAMILRKIK